MEDLILKKGMFPSRRRRYCTEELKIKPLQRYIRALQDAPQQEYEVINAVGVRADESEARSKLPGRGVPAGRWRTPRTALLPGWRAVGPHA